jgi:ribosomal protein S18 acetylase RimI-like enzyme
MLPWKRFLIHANSILEDIPQELLDKFQDSPYIIDMALETEDPIAYLNITPDRIEYDVRKSRMNVNVEALLDGELPVGHLYLRIPMGRDHVQVGNVDLLPALQGMGIGREMYQRALAEAQDKWVKPDFSMTPDSVKMHTYMHNNPDYESRPYQGDPITRLTEEGGEWSREENPGLYQEYRKKQQ